MGQPHFLVIKFCPRGRARDAAPLCKNLGHPLYLRNYQSEEVQNFTSTWVVSNTLFECEKFSPMGRVRGAAPLSVNLGPNHISETIRAGKLKFYTQLGRVKYSFWGVKIFGKGSQKGAAPRSVNSGPLISRKLLELEI